MDNQQSLTNAEIFGKIFQAVKNQPQINATGLDLLLTEGLEQGAQDSLKKILCGYQSQVQEDLKSPRGIQQYNQAGILEYLKKIKNEFV